MNGTDSTFSSKNDLWFAAQWEHVMETCLGSWLKIVFLSGVFNVLKQFIKTDM